MNGSVDCGECSPIATDEEPPGPLDLSSSILSCDPPHDAKGHSADTTVSFAPAFGHSFSAVATVPGPASSSTHNGHAFVAPGDDSAFGSGRDSALSFLRRTTSSRTRAFRRRHFPDVSNREWNDWRWQTRHRIRTLAQIDSMLRLSEEEREALVQGGTMLPVGISPYYMSLLDPDNAWHPLRRTVVPTLNEFVRTEGEADDPLGEDAHSPVPGLVH
ncbi:MAG: hypothetical protein WD229_17590, partial [Pirellulales bacterium]